GARAGQGGAIDLLGRGASRADGDAAPSATGDRANPPASGPRGAPGTSRPRRSPLRSARLRLRVAPSRRARRFGTPRRISATAAPGAARRALGLSSPRGGPRGGGGVPLARRVGDLVGSAGRPQYESWTS